MKPRAHLLGLVALALVALALPTSAAARPGWVEMPRSLHLSFEAKASNGYTISLKTAGHKQVTLHLERGSASAMYRTTGRVSRNGIEVDFGELGEISVDFRGRPGRFEPYPDLKKFGLPPSIFPQRKCRGRKPQLEIGAFRGTIRFEGENGFARFEGGSVKGRMQRTYRRLCKGGLGGGLFNRSLRRASASLSRASASATSKRKPNGVYMNVLAAGGVQGDRRVAFATFGFSGRSGDPLLDELIRILGPLAIAATSEHRDGVLIQREGTSLGDKGSLIVSPPKRKPITATVAFPKPFEGTGDYQQAPGSSPSWLGSLVARLPGAGAVPVTGAGLTPVFCRISLDEEGIAKNPCLESAEKLLGTARTPDS